MASIKFFEAVLNDELPISKAWAENGWPELLHPFFLARCQLQNGSVNAQKALTLGIHQDISRGKLRSVIQRIPWIIESNVTEPHVCAQDFAAWLTARGMEPSPLVAEWIEETSGATHQAKPQEEKPLGTTAPTGRWPWGNHHTEALGHLEAAALRFWVNHDPADPGTLPTNDVVAEWLQNERKVSSKKLAYAIASMLRLDGIKPGIR